MYPEELTAGNWGPLNFTVQRTFGCDAAVLFAHLSQIAKRYSAKKTDGWFYIAQPKLIEVTGMTRKPLERSIDILANAGLLLIDKRGQNNTRHYQLVQSIEQLEAICAAHQSAPKQTLVRKSNAPKKPKQTAKTAKEQSFGNSEFVQQAEPVGKTEQLAVATKPAKPKPEFKDAACRLIDHLNAVAGTKYRHVDTHIKAFERVLKAKEGTEEDIRMVIELKAYEWKPKPDMHHNLNPTTLTRPSNFPRYLDQAMAAKEKVQQGTFGRSAEDIRWAEMAARVVAKLENRYQ